MPIVVKTFEDLPPIDEARLEKLNKKLVNRKAIKNDVFIKNLEEKPTFFWPCQILMGKTQCLLSFYYLSIFSLIIWRVLYNNHYSF